MAESGPKKTTSGRIVCKYGIRCRFVNKDEGCTFYHPRCKKGAECEFYKDGKCGFFHKKGNDDDAPTDNRDRSRSKTPSKRASRSKSAKSQSKGRKSATKSKSKARSQSKTRSQSKARKPKNKSKNGKKEQAKKKKQAAKKKPEEEEEVKRTKSGRIICKYGFRCYFLRLEDSNCRFFHPRCKNGDECPYAENGTCGYFHGKV